MGDKEWEARAWQLAAPRGSPGESGDLHHLPWAWASEPLPDHPCMPATQQSSEPVLLVHARVKIKDKVKQNKIKANDVPRGAGVGVVGALGDRVLAL